MIKSVRHIGVVVNDINKCLFFYKDLLGLTVCNENIEEGEYIDTLVGIKNVTLKWIKFKTEDNFIIELLEYCSPKDKSKNIKMSNSLGLPHIAFTVRNIENLYNLLSKNDLTPKNRPQISPDGKVKVMYFRDPENNIIEAVEELENNE